MSLLQTWRVSAGGASIEVQADNWLGALAQGLPEVGLELGALGRLVCALDEDGSATARDPRGGTEVRIEPVGAPTPPEFDMPSSTFATLYVPQLRTVSPDPGVRSNVPANEVAGGGAASTVPAAPAATGFAKPPPYVPPVASQSPPAFVQPATSVPPTVAPTVPPPAAAPAFRASPTLELEGGGFALPVPAALPQVALDDRLEDLFMRLGDISEAASVSEACAAALKIAAELVPCDAGCVLVRTRAGDGLRFRAALGPASKAVVDTVIPLDKGIAGFTFQLGLALTIEDAKRDMRHYGRVDKTTGYQTRSVLAAPIQADEGGIYGCLELINPPRPFNADDLEVATRVAASLGSYLRAGSAGG